MRANFIGLLNKFEENASYFASLSHQWYLLDERKKLNNAERIQRIRKEAACAVRMKDQ